MSAMQRNKGAGFERLIANKFRKRFPELAKAIRRSQQGDRAHTPDVVGLPGLWVECQHAKQTTPERKLKQAVRDVDDSMGPDACRPIAVVRENRSAIRVYLRLGDLREMIDPESAGYVWGALDCAPMSMDFDAFCDLYDSVRGEE